MTENEKKLLNEFLAKTLNIADEQVIASLYNEAGELNDISSLINADADRIQKIKSDAKQVAENQYKRGQKETMTQFEKSARERYHIDNTELRGLELVEAIIEASTSELKNKGNESIEKHPDYIKFRKQFEKEKEELKTSYEKKIEEINSGYSKKETMSIVNKFVNDELMKMENQIRFPETPAVKSNLINNFLRTFESGSYRIDNNQPILIDEDGKPVTDAHGNIINLSSVVKQRVGEWFEILKATDRSSAGNQKATDPEPMVIKSKEEFLEATKKAKTPEERAKILDSYKANIKN